MTLIDYIDQPPAANESATALQAFLDTPVFFKRPPEEAAPDPDQPLDADSVINWPLEAKHMGEAAMLVFYTSADHPRLDADEIASLPLRACLQLSFDFPGADGVVLVNRNMHWKSFAKENFETILSGVPGGGYR